MKRDLLSLAELDREEILAICDDAARLKVELRAGRGPRSLVGKTLAMIFEKPSLRTRVTFETGVKQLGGASVYLTHEDIRLGERETVADIARNLSRWVDLIVARTFSHTTLVELARHATIPVINGLTDLSHPCQVLADLQTLREHRGHDLRHVRDLSTHRWDFLFPCPCSCLFPFPCMHCSFPCFCCFIPLHR